MPSTRSSTRSRASRSGGSPRNHVRHTNGSANGAAGGNGGGGSLDAEDESSDGPRIAKRKRFAAKPMDPEEAALQMELLGHAFFLFTNTENGRAALLYRRNDGDLGLIETTT